MEHIIHAQMDEFDGVEGGGNNSVDDTNDVPLTQGGVISTGLECFRHQAYSTTFFMLSKYKRRNSAECCLSSCKACEADGEAFMCID